TFFDIYANQISDNAIEGIMNNGYLIPNNANSALTITIIDIKISTDTMGTSTVAVTVSFNPSIITNWFVRPAGNSMTTILDHVYRLSPSSVYMSNGGSPVIFNLVNFPSCIVSTDSALAGDTIAPII